MATYRDLTSELNSGAVVTRESWDADQIVFKVVGDLLAPSFYDNYGVGGDRLPIDDVLCYSNGISVILGWRPSLDDEKADDWYVEVTTTGDTEDDADQEEDMEPDAIPDEV